MALSGRSRRILRLGAIGLVGLLLAIQLVPVVRTNPPVRSEPDAPPEIAEILRRACYDCHSHETRWPWYSGIAPVSWWLVSHVDDGRGDLNFSEWPVFDFELQELALRDIEEQVSEGEMPLTSYTLLHPRARLTDADRAALLRWVRGGR